ncbi:Translation initiation factor 3 subunit J component [Thecaphora frezii]
MSDWENDDEPVVQQPKIAAAARKKFDDEDLDDQVKDDWEEEDSEPEKKPAVVIPPKKKKTVKQKIAEKEAEERRRQEEGLDASEEEDWDETPAERRRREKEAQLKSDVENAATLFGGARISDDDGVAKLKSSNPSSKEDWEAFSNLIYTELIKKHAAKPGFDKHFVPHLLRNLCTSLRDVDVRKASTLLKEIAEEKVKAEKEAKRTGGQKKAAAKPKTVGTASAKNIIDTRAYGDEALDDDLDFM